MICLFSGHISPIRNKTERKYGHYGLVRRRKPDARRPAHAGLPAGRGLFVTGCSVDHRLRLFYG